MNKIYLLSFFVFINSSCSNLEENLKGEITTDFTNVPITKCYPESDYNRGLFSELSDAGTASHGGYFTLQEITSDEMCIPARGSDWVEGGTLELHRHTYTSSNDFIKNTWNNTYASINTCNEFLAKTGNTANEKAQVRALRAYFYMRLCDLYGNVKIIEVKSKDAPQSTRAQVFDFIESELLSAIGISRISEGMDLSAGPLDSKEVNKNRINVYGALGILSKLYLNAEIYKGVAKYTEAAIAADYIIKKSPYKLSDANFKVKNLGRRPKVTEDQAELVGYAANFGPNNETSPENIFTVFYDENKAGGMNFSQMCLHYSSQSTYNFAAQPWNGYTTLEEFYNSYEESDARKKCSFLVGPQKDFTGSSILDYSSDDGDPVLNYNPRINELAPNAFREAGARPAKFSYKQLGKPNMSNDYPIIRLGEIYLVRAEALARKSGHWADALNDVNTIRRRAGVAEWSAGQVTAESFLAERGREMFQESARRTDLIRFGKFNAAWWEKPASLPFRNVFPIPADAILTSAGTLVQNSGY